MPTATKPEPYAKRYASEKTGVNAKGEALYTIRDVPIVSEHQFAKSPKQIVDVDRAWLQAAVENHAALWEKNGYAPALHVNHHGQGETELAGRFIPRSVRLMDDAAGPTCTLFADLIEIPQATFDAIQAGKLAYRSVEINFSSDVPKISSLALLADEEPFFKLPLLQDTTVENASAGGRTTIPPFRTGRRPIRAFAQAGERLAILYAEAPMPEEAKKPEEKPAEKKPEGVTLEGIAKMIADGFSALTAAMKGTASSKAADDDKKPDAAPAEQPKKDDDEKMKAAAAVAMAEVDTLKGKVLAMERTSERKEAIAGAVASLKGYVLAEPVEKKAGEVFDSLGAKGLALYVETMTKNAPREPGDFAAAGAPGASTGNVPPEVAKYGEKGPDALKWATDRAREHAALGPGYPLTLARYLESQEYFGKKVAVTK